MTIVELIIGAQLTLLLSIAAMNIYVSRTDVLSGRYIDRDRSSTWDDYVAHPDATVIEPNPQARAFPFSPPQPAGSNAPRELATQADVQTETGIVREVGSSQILRAPATLPPGIRIYAIGDIHGRADLLRILLEKVDADRRRRPVDRPILLFIGDYVDRGPSSREVLDILLGHRGGCESIFLKGNHETFISRFLEDPVVLDEWRFCGGLETLLSYGLKPTFSPDKHERKTLSEELARAISTRHLAFLNSLQLSFQCGGFLFVHAGIRPGVPVADQDEKDLLWIREDFLGSEALFGAFVVHGHTPVRAPEMRFNRLNIDTGAFATGRLTCAVIEGSTVMALSTEPEGRTNSAPVQPRMARPSLGRPATAP